MYRGTKHLGRLILFAAGLSFGILLVVASIGLVVRLIAHFTGGSGG